MILETKYAQKMAFCCAKKKGMHKKMTNAVHVNILKIWN